MVTWTVVGEHCAIKHFATDNSCVRPAFKGKRTGHDNYRPHQPWANGARRGQLDLQVIRTNRLGTGHRRYEAGADVEQPPVGNLVFVDGRLLCAGVNEHPESKGCRRRTTGGGDLCSSFSTRLYLYIDDGA